MSTSTSTTTTTSTTTSESKGKSNAGSGATARHRPRESKWIANKHRILNRIFQEGKCSRFGLARKLNINASTIGKSIDDFLARGVLLEAATGPTRRGRSPVPVWLNPDHGRFLGVDFEALRARAVLTDFAGAPLVEREAALPTGAGRDAVLETVLGLAREVARGRGGGPENSKTAAGAVPLFAVGLAAPGNLDLARGRIARYSLLPDFEDVPLLEAFQAAFDCPVFLEENIRCLTLAEFLRGAGRGLRHFVCLAARSGVGMGTVIDGRMYAGDHGLAGKVGWTYWPGPDGPKRMTELVSAKGIVEQARALLAKAARSPAHERLRARGDDLSLDDLVAAADAGDRDIQALLERAGDNLGLIAANLANLFAPEIIVLAGEVPRCCPLVRQALQRGFERHTLEEISRHATLVDGVLSPFAAALGAACLGFLKTFPIDGTVLPEALSHAALRTTNHAAATMAEAPHRAAAS